MKKNLVQIHQKKKGSIQRPCLHKGVRRLETATESRSRDVQGRVVRTSIVVAPGGSIVRAAAAPTARANTVASSPQGTPDMAGMKMLYKGMKKFKFFLGSEKLISKGMKLLYKGMKKFNFFYSLKK
jgi:hypothetical protein